MIFVALAFAAGLALALAVAGAVVRRQRAEIRGLRAAQAADLEIDPLTGAANWAGLMTHLRRARARRTDDAGDGGIVVLDLAGFSALNASLGRAAGDEVLITVAQRLTDAVRTGELLARTDGAHFVVALEAPVTHYGARRAAARLMDVVRRPLQIGSQEMLLEAHAGVATGVRADSELLVEHAHAALTKAREEGRDHPVVYDDAVGRDTARSFHQAQQLKTAAAAGELYLAYQPIHRTQDGILDGLEALLRWDSRTFGPVSPADFIPIAEDTGTIIEIGAWVLEAACHDLVILRRDDPDLVMSVNVSAHQLHARGFCELVEAVLHDTGAPPPAVQLELTESALARPEDVEDQLQRLQDLGVRIALDDVGTGYSSLAQIAALPIDTIKLDRSLIARFGDPKGGAERVFTSLVALGQSLRLDVVAEGVETAAQARVVRDAGCTHEQGFLHARPEKLEVVRDYVVRAARAGEIAAAG